jgi:hypothetical protein
VDKNIKRKLVFQKDFKSAYLNAPLPNPTFLEQPESMIGTNANDLLLSGSDQEEVDKISTIMEENFKVKKIGELQS